MWIYKITNIQNGKVYIGQTTGSVESRFKRHLNDAESNRLTTHLSNAIRLYGRDSFKVETIDRASTQEELTDKEYYWIKKYDSVNQGYNETDSKEKCGGNTYKSKTSEEMKEIKEKIRQTKIGKKNPMARRVKMINIETNEVSYYDTIISCAKALGIKGGKTSITERLNGHRTCPLRGKYIFEYCDE